MAGGRELDVIHLDLSKAFDRGASPPVSDQTSAVWRVMLCPTVVRKLPVEKITARCLGWCIFWLVNCDIWGTAGFRFGPTTFPGLICCSYFFLSHVIFVFLLYLGMVMHLGFVVWWPFFLKKKLLGRKNVTYISKGVNPWFWSKIPNILRAYFFVKKDFGC